MVEEGRASELECSGMLLTTCVPSRRVPFFHPTRQVFLVKAAK